VAKLLDGLPQSNVLQQEIIDYQEAALMVFWDLASGFPIPAVVSESGSECDKV
jgi:exopolyphosphatase/pppGpp-phosphohydrolase